MVFFAVMPGYLQDQIPNSERKNTKFLTLYGKFQNFRYQAVNKNFQKNSKQ